MSVVGTLGEMMTSWMKIAIADLLESTWMMNMRRIFGMSLKGLVTHCPATRNLIQAVIAFAEMHIKEENCSGKIKS